MNIAMFSHFVSIIISSRRSLLCSSIMMKLSTLVVCSRFWLIIRWIIFPQYLQLRSGFLSLKRCVCGICIFLPIGEKVLLIAGLVPRISICSSSTGIFLPYLVIFLEDHDVLLNANFCCCCRWTSLNTFFFIIGNIGKNRIST